MFGFLSTSFGDLFTEIFDIGCYIAHILIEFSFGWLNIPELPVSIQTSINSFLDFLFSNAGFFGFFIRPTTLNIIIPLLIYTLGIRYVYRILKWVINHLPLKKWIFG